MSLRALQRPTLRAATTRRLPQTSPALATLLRIRAMSTTQYEHILTSKPAEGVALITLNRPKALNALSSPLFAELNKALAEFDEDNSIGALVITGSDRAFAGECTEHWLDLTRSLTRGLCSRR